MKMHIEYDDFGEYAEYLEDEEDESEFTMRGMVVHMKKNIWRLIVSVAALIVMQ